MPFRTTDLDHGLEKPKRAPDRIRVMHEERDRIQAQGGSAIDQRWLLVEGRWIIRSHYWMADNVELD